MKAGAACFSGRSILYVQYANPGAYPPVQHGARILADDGYSVTFVGVRSPPNVDLQFPPIERVILRLLPYCSPGYLQKIHYLVFCLWALWNALTQRPSWIYVSDALSCPPALLLHAIGFAVIYHEHDSPETRKKRANTWDLLLRWTRQRLGRVADLCILPNHRRLEVFETDVARNRPSVCVWNCPPREEATVVPRKADDKFIVLYQGTIVPARVPLTVIDALAQLPRSVELRIVGYATTGTPGYVSELRSYAEQQGVADRATILDAVPRDRLLEVCRDAHVGLSFMPVFSSTLNAQHMTGASNKAFDYLACGLVMLVSPMADWEEMFVAPGYAVTCNPDDPAQIAETICRLATDRQRTNASGEKGRRQILREWNYESQFEPVRRFVGATVSGMSVNEDVAGSQGAMKSLLLDSKRRTCLMMTYLAQRLLMLGDSCSWPTLASKWIRSYPPPTQRFLKRAAMVHDAPAWLLLLTASPQEVLIVGAALGQQLQALVHRCRKITCVEENDVLRELAEQRAARSGWSKISIISPADFNPALLDAVDLIHFRIMTGVACLLKNHLTDLAKWLRNERRRAIFECTPRYLADLSFQISQMGNLREELVLDVYRVAGGYWEPEEVAAIACDVRVEDLHQLSPRWPQSNLLLVLKSGSVRKAPRGQFGWRISGNGLGIAKLPQRGSVGARSILRVGLNDTGAARVERAERAIQIARAALAPSYRTTLPRVRKLARRFCSIESVRNGAPGTRLQASQLSSATEWIAQLHRATGTLVTSKDDEAWKRFATPRIVKILTSMSQIVEEHGNAKIKCEWSGLVDVIADPPVAEGIYVCQTHGDFQPSNILFDPHSGAVTGVVDWEVSQHYWIPARDIYQLLATSDGAILESSWRRYNEVVLAERAPFSHLMKTYSGNHGAMTAVNSVWSKTTYPFERFQTVVDDYELNAVTGPQDWVEEIFFMIHSVSQWLRSS